MNVELVQNLASLFRHGTMAELEYVDSDFRVALRRPFVRVQAEDVKDAVPALRMEKALAGKVQVKAPAAGVFYRAHPLSGEPGIAVGTVVAEGEIIGYLEIDGMVSGVRTTAAGRVESIDVPDGGVAGFDTVLLSFAA